MYFIHKELLLIVCSHILIEHSERKLCQKFDVYMLLAWFLIRMCPTMNVYVTHAAYM